MEPVAIGIGILLRPPLPRILNSLTIATLLTRLLVRIRIVSWIIKVLRYSLICLDVLVVRL